MAEDAEQPQQAGPSRTWSALIGSLAAVTVVALVVLLVGLTWDEEDEDVERGENAISVARQVGTGLIDISPPDIDKNVTMLREFTTGEFQKQFIGDPPPFAADLRNQNIRSEGRIVEAGLGEMDDESAEVVMIGRATIDLPTIGRQDRGYQMVAHLRWISGGWAVDDMEVR